MSLTVIYCNACLNLYEVFGLHEQFKTHFFLPQDHFFVVCFSFLLSATALYSATSVAMI